MNKSINKLILTACLSFASLHAHSALTITDASAAFTFSGYDGEPAIYTGTLSSGVTGKITATTAGNLIATFIGREVGDASGNPSNRFRFLPNAANEVFNSGSVFGNTLSRVITGPGPINFRFITGNNNDQSNNGSDNIAIMTVPNLPAGDFDYVLGFEDGRGGGNARDFDDFVVALKFFPVSAIPEASTYAMFLAGLSTIGLISRRRKSA